MPTLRGGLAYNDPTTDAHRDACVPDTTRAGLAGPD